MTKKNKQLTNDEILAFIPLFRKNVFLEEKVIINEGIEETIKSIKKMNNHAIQRFVRKIKVKIPEYSSLELDKFGACVVENINGQNSIKDIAIILSEIYPETLEQQYDRLLLFFGRLEQEYKLIEFK